MYLKQAKQILFHDFKPTTVGFWGKRRDSPKTLERRLFWRFVPGSLPLLPHHFGYSHKVSVL